MPSCLTHTQTDSFVPEILLAQPADLHKAGLQLANQVSAFFSTYLLITLLCMVVMATRHGGVNKHVDNVRIWRSAVVIVYYNIVVVQVN